MNIRQFLKWSLVLLAFLAYKQMEAATPVDSMAGGVAVTSAAPKQARMNE